MCDDYSPQGSFATARQEHARRRVAASTPDTSVDSSGAGKEMVASLLRSAADVTNVAALLAESQGTFDPSFVKGLRADAKAMRKTAGFIDSGYDCLRAERMPGMDINTATMQPLRHPTGEPSDQLIRPIRTDRRGRPIAEDSNIPPLETFIGTASSARKLEVIDDKNDPDRRR